MPTKSYQHIAKDPIQPGQVNAKGQIATRLPNGKIQMVNMLEPRVMGPEGRPVKG